MRGDPDGYPDNRRQSANRILNATTPSPSRRTGRNTTGDSAGADDRDAPREEAEPVALASPAFDRRSRPAGLADRVSTADACSTPNASSTNRRATTPGDPTRATNNACSPGENHNVTRTLS